jgi:hypothetical protein
MARLHVFRLELLELSTLDIRRFLFRLPESLSRWPDGRGFKCTLSGIGRLSHRFEGRPSDTQTFRIQSEVLQ